MGLADLMYTPADPALAAQQQAMYSAAPPEAPAPPAPAEPPAPPQGVAYPGTFQQTQSGTSFEQAMRLARLGAAAPRAAAWQPVQRSTQVQQGIALDPDAKAALDEEKAAAAEQGAAGADLMAQQAKDAATKAKEMARFDAGDLAQKQARWDDQTQQLAQYHQKLQGALDEAAKPDDPRKWWHDKGGFDKVTTGLAAVLNGFTYGFSGGKLGESPKDWVESQIKDSMTAQRASKDADAKAKSEGYNLLKEQLGDEDRTHLATELAHRQTVMSWLDAKAAETQLPAQQRLAAAKLRQELAQNQLKTLTEIDEKTADKITTSGAEHYVPASAGGGQDYLSLLKRANEIKELRDKIQGTGPEADKQRADLDKELADTLSTRANTHKVRAETDKMRADAAGGIALPEAPADTGGIFTQMASILPKRWEGATNHEIEAYNAQIPLALGIKSARGAALAEDFKLYPDMPEGEKDRRVAALKAAVKRSQATKQKGAEVADE